ncbi:MAG: membrane protein insertion efficiency factor [Sulfuricurvum sp. PC08-66]|nr:MAG: membrane protein insertion efficiency factor [Sulfuricurvum sp. PC08-66]
MRKFALWLLALYQRFFTLLGYGSCRYYPSCSEYAKWHFQKTPIHRAFVASLLRILRCNQLFEGGIDYPVVKCSKPTKFKKISVQFWLVPKDAQNCYLIKTFST